MYSTLIILKLFCFIQLSKAIITETNVNLDILNRIFFDSLRLHPKFHVKENLTEEVKNIIDKYVDDFFDMTVASVENELKQKSKRSLKNPQTSMRDGAGNYIFKGLDHMYQIPIDIISELDFFQQRSKWFTASLEQDMKKKNMNFVVSKFENNNFIKMSNWIVPSADEFAIYTESDITYIAVKATDTYYSGIWEFNGDALKHIQNIDLASAKDMKIWSTEEELHMAVANIEDLPTLSNGNRSKSYNKTVIYKWLGSHFDPIQTINEPVSKLVYFNLENKNFLVLIVKHIYGDSSEGYAEIYQYNLQIGQYEIQQRIPLEKCEDIKHFAIKKHNGKDFYLAVPSYVSGESHSEFPSIIYKYVDGYFLPFQDLKIETILEFLPVEITDSKFLLIARSEFQPLKTFQYDGWSFRESTHDINSNLPKREVISMKYLNIENIATLVVRFSGEDTLQFYKLNFVHENQVNEFHETLLSWCKNNLKLLEETGEEEGIRKERQASEIIPNNEETVDGDGNIIDSLEQLGTKLNSASLLLNELEEDLKLSLQAEGEHVLENVEADEIIVNNANIQFLTTKTINNKNISEILDNLVDTNKDTQWTNDLILQHAQIDSKIQPQMINGRKADDIIKLNDDLEINELNVNGQTEFTDSVTTNTLNNVVFDQNQILMNDLDQKFDTLNIENVRSKNINPGMINSRSLKDLEVPTNTQRSIDRMSNLKTKKIAIGGFINNVDMRTLDKYSLKITGDQSLSEKFIFQELQANNMEIHELSNKNVRDNFVHVDSGQYNIDQDVQFTKPLNVNHLVVEDFLDLIPVVDGKLQILLKDTEEVQHIGAKKIIDEVELLNPIKLQGNIQSDELQKINPVITVDGPFLFDGDFEISGNTTIEKILKVGDVTTKEQAYSARKVLSQGLLLKDKEITIHLNFQQQLNVDEIFIDKVNEINPQTWVVTGTQNQQIIHGAKVFVNDVTITGNTNFFKVNNIELPDLENSVLRITGDQIITGKHTVINVIADRVLGNNITLGENQWKNILTANTDQTISGTTIVKGDTIANFTKSNSTRITGTINNFNFTKIIAESVMKNANKTISSHKSFRNYTTENLILPNLQTMNRKRVVRNGNVRLENAVVENIHFSKTCNDVEVDRFGENSFGESQVEIVSELRDIDKLVVYGNVYIESGFLNHVYLQDFEKDTVKIDEDNVFENVIFDTSVFSDSPVILHGHMENVDFENLVLSNSDELQIVSGPKTFRNNVTVFGNVILEGVINDFNLSNACSFAELGEKEKEIEILGDAIFTKGPHVHKIFNITVQDILTRAWFKNKETSLPQFIHFNNITLFNNVTAMGTVDGVQLEDLRDNYFSKTRDQKISGGLYFANHVRFSGNLVSPQLALNGDINGIKISDLPRTILLQDEDQLFEEMVYLENVHFDDLHGEYTVNNLNLKTDVLRYDNENMITGIKQVNKLKTENIEFKKNISIQNVDIIGWLNNAILKNGIFNIEKRKILRRDAYFEKGVTLQGSLNGEMFTNETIMLKSIPQNITGVKNFEVDHLEVMKFRNLKLKGLLNDMRVSELFSDQSENEDFIFKSPMHFHTDIFTKNLCLKKTYKGMNMKKMISEILELNSTDVLKADYGKFLNMSEMIKNNLKEQAFYLQYYRELQELQKPHYIINSCCDNPTLTYFDTMNNSCIMNYYYWDKDAELFMKSAESAVDMGYLPLKIESFSLGRSQFVYMEHPNEDPNTEDLINGIFWRIDNFHQPVRHGSLVSNGIKQITPFAIDQSDCLFLLFQQEKPPEILCDFNSRRNIIFNQSIQAGKYIQSTVTSIDGVPFIILIGSQEDNLRIPRGSVEVWSQHDTQFEIHQVLFLSDPPPKSAATITHRNIHYLSIAYRGGLRQGHVDILRYTKSRTKYELWQKITLSNPVLTEFVVLPSGELVLFVLGSPNETISVFKYTGISGFKKQITTSSIPYITGFKQFSMGKKHFLLVENGDKLRILQAQFKGILKESI